MEGAQWDTWPWYTEGGQCRLPSHPQSETMSSFQELQADDPILRVVSPLIAVREGLSPRCDGTAFLLGPGWAAAANHVIDESASRLGVCRPESGTSDLPVALLALFSLQDSEKRLSASVLRGWRANPLDVTVFALSAEADDLDDFRWTAPAIELLPPKVGTPVAAVGFPGSRFEGHDENGHPQLSLNPTASFGEVVEIHMESRDRAILPFPCFQTNLRIDGGMSGGPIINLATGCVCGLTVTSMPSAGDHEEHSSYAASLWPIVTTRIVGSPVVLDGEASYPLMRLFERGVLHAADLSHVRLESAPGGKASASVHYKRGAYDTRHRG